ncbi:4-(cytidine 5'-diphospho)-2-C-methyl-D-erythritol kinase [Marinibactrum halimedae]|nr:4-(cytidine 5'-diphospho)-2-C-methyl-D-erythritol kinase [Marinibactrum halimedae]
MIPPVFTLPAPAKLNLFLHITGRRDDGYHNLQTLFQLLNIGDELDFYTTANPEAKVYENGLSLSCSNPALESKDNLVFRAAQHLQNQIQKNGSNTQSISAHIHLKKKLPFGGGIGGGSSDAATTLLGLNHLWDAKQSEGELANIGQQLGADIPVFIRGKTAFAEGIGEKLTPVTLEEKWYVVIAPNCHVSTPQIFSHKDLTRDTPVIKVAASLERDTKNDCETLVKTLYPDVNEALKWLSKFGQSRMTGTGSCVFLPCVSEEKAVEVLSMKPSKFNGFIAKGVNQSPLHEQLLSHYATGV